LNVLLVVRRASGSLVDGGNAALREGAFAEETGNDVLVVVVLLEHAKVHFEVGEAHLEELGQVCTQSLVLAGVDLLNVSLLRGHDVRHDRGRERGLSGEGGAGLLLSSDDGLAITRFVSKDCLVQLSERGVLVAGLRNVVSILVGNGNFEKFGLLGLHLLNDYFLLGGLLDKNVSPDLVAKTVVLPCAHAEIGRITARLLRGNKINTEFNFAVWLDAANGQSLRLHFVTICLYEYGVLWPFGLAIVTHCPEFGERLSRLDLVSVTKAFFYEASRVFDEFLGVCLGAKATSLHSQ